jgi:hypothetical protein
MATGKTNALFKLTGDKALLNRMKRLEKAMQNKIAKQAITKMMRVVAKAQKAAAPHPVLKQSIGMRVGQSKKTGEEVAKTGINVGKSPTGKLNKKGNIIKGSQQLHVAHLLTLGSRPRYTGATTRAKGRRGQLVSTGNVKRYTGIMKQHLFLKQASEAVWPQAVRVGRQIAWDGILKAL